MKTVLPFLRLRYLTISFGIVIRKEFPTCITLNSNFTGISMTDSQSTLRILLNIRITVKDYESTLKVLAIGETRK